MDTTGDGCSNFFMWLAIVLVVIVTLVLPVAAFISDPAGGGAPFLIIGLAAFSYLIAWFWGFEEHKLFGIVLYGSLGIGVVLFVRLLFLDIRDTFARDPRSGMAEILAIPVAVLVYGLALWLLPQRLSEGTWRILRPILKWLAFLIISGLVYLIYR
jgi:hypothetical protein